MEHLDREAIGRLLAGRCWPPGHGAGGPVISDGYGDPRQQWNVRLPEPVAAAVRRVAARRGLSVQTATTMLLTDALRALGEPLTTNDPDHPELFDTLGASIEGRPHA